jgi:hypothetical protein
MRVLPRSMADPYAEKTLLEVLGAGSVDDFNPPLVPSSRIRHYGLYTTTRSARSQWLPWLFWGYCLDKGSYKFLRVYSPVASMYPPTRELFRSKKRMLKDWRPVSLKDLREMGLSDLEILAVGI